MIVPARLTLILLCIATARTAEDPCTKEFAAFNVCFYDAAKKYLPGDEFLKTERQKGEKCLVDNVCETFDKATDKELRNLFSKNSTQLTQAESCLNASRTQIAAKVQNCLSTAVPGFKIEFLDLALSFGLNNQEVFGTYDTIPKIARDMCPKEARSAAVACLQSTSAQSKPARIKRMTDICLSKLNCFQKLPVPCQSRKLKLVMRGCSEKAVVNIDSMKPSFLACLPKKLSSEEEKRAGHALRHVHEVFRLKIKRFSDACQTLYDSI